MSKNINVNPGQYKVAGRERQGENLRQERNKQDLVKNRGADRPPKRAAQRRALMSGRNKKSG